MKTHEYTRVVFRVFEDGSVIALFPHEPADYDGNCMSYMHVGQHGAADYSHCMKITRPATFEERQALQNELLDIGYKLKVQRRKSS